MSEFRQNLATREWVIVSPGRGKRPSDFSGGLEKKAVPPPHRKDCPFCPGNENMTPDAVYVHPDNDNWQVRVVPNRYAALDPELATTRSHLGSFLAAKGYGVAEVVIESPGHDKNVALMQMGEVSAILTAYRQRYEEISKKEEIQLITIFRNYGARAGTSLEHPHSQIIATPIVPPHVRYPIEQSIRHYDQTGRCVYCEMLEEELRQKERLIVDSDSFVAFCPFAARTPFESRIYPKRHMASFSGIYDEEIEELSWILRILLLKIYNCLGNPDYNYIIRSAPIGDEDTRYLHWYLVMIPRITTPAGFEMGSGIYINTVAPEDSARFLRETATD